MLLPQSATWQRTTHNQKNVSLPMHYFAITWKFANTQILPNNKLCCCTHDHLLNFTLITYMLFVLISMYILKTQSICILKTTGSQLHKTVQHWLHATLSFQNKNQIRVAALLGGPALAPKQFICVCKTYPVPWGNLSEPNSAHTKPICFYLQDAVRTLLLVLQEQFQVQMQLN